MLTFKVVASGYWSCQMLDDGEAPMIQYAITQIRGNGPIEHMHSDGALPFQRVCKNMVIGHTHSQPGEHETNAIIQRTVSYTHLTLPTIYPV